MRPWGELAGRLKTLKNTKAKASLLSIFLLLVGVFAAFQWFDEPISSSNRLLWNPFNWTPSSQRSLECPAGKEPVICSDRTVQEAKEFPRGPTCPDYFRWIHEDLRHWNHTGITREMVESGKNLAHFRLVIVGGKAYVETYRRSFQTRDVFTIWGILQLLRRYPGRIPDLDLMFNCGDVTVVPARDFGDRGLVPPPVFHYCGNEASQDIVFPDWSFWGWPEVNIKPWVPLLKDLTAGNRRSKWKDRDPTAYWKGNPYVSESRQDLLKCQLSESHDWNARLYIQNWDDQIRRGFKESNLADQCTHRYKIYIEGAAWSVSRKYIMACDSPTLAVNPRYHDFFSRSLLPNHHFWPIRADNKCPSIKFAVDWGNSHQQEAQDIGNAGSSFILNDLRMEYVYDYMFHVLIEYARLLRYEPTVPSEAKPICLESMACTESGRVEEFMRKSMVEGPLSEGPCTFPPRDSLVLESFMERKNESMKQVQRWENEAWDKENKTT